jgi:hypothetical protein
MLSGGIPFRLPPKLSRALIQGALFSREPLPHWRPNAEISFPYRRRSIQAKIDASDKANAKRPSAKKAEEERPMQAGARKYPELPFPKQHQSKPGQEYKLDPEPLYDAPHISALKSSSEKLLSSRAGIAASAAALPYCLHAKERMSPSSIWTKTKTPNARRKPSRKKGRNACLSAAM